MARTKQTELAYEERALALLGRVVQEEGLHWQDDPLRACKIITSWRPMWGKSTWRQYKASMMYFMGRFGPKEAVEYLSACGSEDCRRASRLTSARKSKSLPAKDLVDILSTLQDRAGRWDRLLALWLVAGRATGLRPGEWKHAALEGEHLTHLVVKNAKATNNRGNGEHRTLDLRAVPDSSRKAIDSFLRYLSEEHAAGSTFEDLYEKVRHRLKNIARQLWPDRKKLPVLYSCRHQVAADLKGSQLSLPEIAAVMGHATDETATTHYGKRSAGESGGHVRPMASEVANVRKKYQKSANYTPNPNSVKPHDLSNSEKHTS